jgi:hypothetical protein
MNATSGFHEPLVHCDESELKLPECTGELIALKGASASQTSFAANVRNKKLAEWAPDLSPKIMAALRGIADATWWLANQDKDSSNIGWPKSWTAVEELRQSELGQPSSVNRSRERVLGQPPVPASDLEQFELFARKACQLPEMAYLTMMALLYRQTKDPNVLVKFREARRRVDGHLDAIDNILGSPGE